MEVNLWVAFIFGALSFFSPCVLPLVPGYLAIFSETASSRFKNFSDNFNKLNIT